VPEQNVQANLSQDEMRTLENLLKKVNNNPDLLNMINSQPESKKDKFKNGSQVAMNNTNGFKKDDMLKRKRSMDKERAPQSQMMIAAKNSTGMNNGFK
jgi:hypothetical protein